jgi:sestrin
MKPEQQGDRWMKKDLVHALCIFVFYNCLACFSIGNGVCPEIDLVASSKS